MHTIKRLSVYITAGHASVTVQREAQRETSANTVPLMLDAMPPSDLLILARFCRAILNYTDTNKAETQAMVMGTE